MRCPKCQYLSFDNGDRCRNCGYEFSLAISAAPLDLPIQDGTEPLGPLADLELRDTPQPAHAAVSSPASSGDGFELPLFTPVGKASPPLVTPAPPRPPLSVRRNAPAPPKPKSPSAPRARATVEEPRLALDTAEIAIVERRPQAQNEGLQHSKDLKGREDLSDVDRSGDPQDSEEPAEFEDRRRSAREGFPRLDRASSTPRDTVALISAPAGARVFAALIDLVIVGGIDAAVLYLTLRILDLHMADARALPVVPFLAFLLLLNGSYFAAFVAAGGQTIGKMASGIRVVPSASGADASERVPVGRAIVRAAAYLVSALPAGVGFVPGLMSGDHRALHDRLADTRVVKA